MGRRKSVVPKVRLSLLVSKDVAAGLGALAAATDADSSSEVVRRALAAYRELVLLCGDDWTVLAEGLLR